jgi:hypothetical protein
MQVKLVVFPAEDGLNIVVWGKWAKGSMRARHFENRSEMIETLENLGLISRKDGEMLEGFVFSDTCPLFSSEIDEEVLASHHFEIA